MITIWIDDYFVVMVMLINIAWIPCMLRVACKHPHVNELNLAN
jgi:hypothetical protein